MMTDREIMQQALEALEKMKAHSYLRLDYAEEAIAALRSRLAQPEQEPVSIRAVAKQAGINLPETYIPTMDDAIAAGDSVLMDEQAALLRECRAALDSLIEQKPTIAGLVCGSTTLGNLKAELSAYRPQGVFGSCPQAREQPEQDVPEASCGNMGPVGWLESPDGVFRANPLYKIKFPSKLLSWQVPLYMALPEQEPVALVIDGVLVKSELPEKYTGHLYTAPPQRT